jgi:F0F1-type ATP synthase membrane subunit b/b'
MEFQIELHLGGNIKSPSFSVKDVRLKKGSVVESLGLLIENKKEEIKKTLTDTLSATKDKVLAKADSLKQEIESGIDTIKKQASDMVNAEKEDLKNKGTGILDSLKTGRIDSLPSSMEEIFNEKKDKLKELKDKIKIGLPKKKNN